MTELREKIAHVCFFRGNEPDETQWKHMQPRYRTLAYEQADAILAIPEIRDALKIKDDLEERLREGLPAWARLGLNPQS